MGDIKVVLQNSIHSIELTSGLFYQQNLQEGYHQLDKTLAQLTLAMNEIFTYKSENKDLDIEEKHLIQVLTEAMKAMEEKDTTLLSDILKYDLKVQFETALASL